MKPGLHDPWAVTTTPTAQESVRQQFENADLAPHGLIQFSGQSYTLNVRVLLTGPQGPNAQLAEAVLGAALKMLFATHPATRQIFQAQRLSEKPLQEAAVTLTLGDLTLYAAAGSHDPILAHRMALDRIATALTEAKQRVPGARALLAKFKVDVTLKIR